MVWWVSGFVGACVHLSVTLYLRDTIVTTVFAQCVRASVTLYLVDTIVTTVFAQSLSNFTCELWMMRRGTLLIWGHRVKGEGQIWHSVYQTLCTRYRLQFLPNHFQTSHVSCGWWEEEPYWFLVTGSKVKVNFGTMYKTLWTRYRLQFLPNHFQTSPVSCQWWEEEPYWLWIMGSKVKVNFGTLFIWPCGHDTNYSLCPITFKLYM